jgi:hypothetical protein
MQKDDTRPDLIEVPDKRSISIDDAPTRADAEALAPWAAEIVEVDGGWIAFRLADDANRYINQS